MNNNEKIIQKAIEEQSVRERQFPTSKQVAAEGTFESAKTRDSHRIPSTEKRCTTKEVYANILYNAEYDQADIFFNFPQPKPVKSEIRADNMLLVLNTNNQPVQLVLLDFSKNFAPGNKKKFEIEQGKGARLSLEYLKHDKTLKIRFSDKEQTHSELDPEYYGVVCDYADDEIIGYTIVELPEFYNIKCDRPWLAIPR